MLARGRGGRGADTCAVACGVVCSRSASGGTVIGGGKNFDVVESYSAPTGRTVLQAGLLPIRYERVDGAVASSAYHPQHFSQSQSQAPQQLQQWGRTYLAPGPLYSSSTVYSSSKQMLAQQQAPPAKQYRSWSKPRASTSNTVPPYTTTLSHNVPPVASINQTQGQLPGYGGHVAQARFLFGAGYGRITADVMARFPQGHTAHAFNKIAPL